MSTCQSSRSQRGWKWMESQVWVQSFGTSAVILLSMSEGTVGEGPEHTCSPKCHPPAVLLPGEGRVDWKAVMKKFGEIGYNGVWMYELSMDTPPSIVRKRKLEYADFYKNAVELYNGETLTRR